MLRRRLLTDQGIVLPDKVGCGQVPVEDVLDAGAAAWTALRVAGGEEGCLPDEPPLQDGRPAAIWY